MFWWPVANSFKLDGVDWPFNLPRNTNIQTLIELFEHKRYSKCLSHSYDKKYKKVALYIDPVNNKFTHAARQIMGSGFWTSKLGKWFDIQHGDPFRIENNTYGKVALIMQQEFY